MEVQTQQIIVLKGDFHESYMETKILQDQLKKAEQLQKNSIQLEMQLKETKKNEDEAIRLAEIAKNELVEVREHLGQWKKRTSELTAENKRYKDLLEKQVESVSQILKYPYIELPLSNPSVGSLARREAQKTSQAGGRTGTQVSSQR